MDQPIAYFDNAATTFPKPQTVLSAVEECMQQYCGNAGRGSHPIAMRSAETVYQAREAVASLFGAPPENVIFTLNTTYALNMAIKGVMVRGGHVLISNMEHNSVLRPVANNKKIRYDVFDSYDPNRRLSSKDIISNIVRKLRPDTKMVICAHSSNICSYSLPSLADIGGFCRRHGLIFVVDAAQSAGHVPINMISDCIDILCLPAHKGLYSPQGLGIMILRDGMKIDTLIEGGNGVNSLEVSMGKSSPERYEGGTLCTPAIAGLVAGISFIKNIGIEAIAQREAALWKRTFNQLCCMKDIEIYDCEDAGGILLFNIIGKDPDALGQYLSGHGFCVRTGYHCAPLAHRSLQTAKGGAVRISFGVFNTNDEVDRLCDTIKKVTAEMP